MLMNNPRRAYKKTQVEAQAAASSSVELIRMLHGKLMEEIDKMSFHLQAKNHAMKAVSAQKSMDILIALDSSLDLSSGDELINNLHRIYEFAISKIYQASRNNDIEEINQLKPIIQDIKDGWDGLSA
ncbi:MAG: flagellar protein FliS [Psychromonas sp.]|jgi:flagellar protein FliS|uniref:flagellar export chaperone FliS n=1 Tax=Psychromonas sp. TaxID=1884585 RepID=UPI0039E4870B